MLKETREKLIECIRKDDKAAFGVFMTPEILSAVFGRFPLLSLLYLYDAKRIVKRYLSELVKERPRNKEASFAEADALFASRAGKCLRYYIFADVPPLEMLAVLGKSRELEKLYAVDPSASRSLPMLHKIYYTRLGAGIIVKGEKLILPREPLSFGEKRTFTRFALIFLSVFILIAALTSVTFFYYGVGSGGNYYRVRSAEEVALSLEKDQDFKLEKDVTLSAVVENYTSKMDGGGHFVYLSAPFAQKLTGEITDVIFVIEKGFVGDAIILENAGALKNVRVIAEEVTFAKSGEVMGLLTAVNTGVIEKCTAVLDVTIEGDGGGDCYFAPFAGENNGTIHSCDMDGSVKARNVDVAGVVGKNGEKGVVTDCVVKGELVERADIKNWTPNVAGIATQNDGTIYGCTVTGSTTSILSAPALEETESPASAYAAGIACVNGGSITSSENRGTVLAESTNGYADAGGIVTLNAHYLSDGTILAGKVDSCTSSGEVKALSYSYNPYAGGIAAQNLQGGEIRGSTVSAPVLATLTLGKMTAGQTGLSAGAGGIVALNVALVEDCRVNAPVRSIADYGHASAGGIVSLNSYTGSYYGRISASRSSGGVYGASGQYNVYVGGIAAENYQASISTCGQTGEVSGETSGEQAYSFIGGIVGYNSGAVEKSFFIGTISDYDESNFVGGICGLIRPSFAINPFTGRYQMQIAMADNYFSAGAHASGSLYLDMAYLDLRARTIYSLAFLETHEGYDRYVTELLDFGGTAASVDAIKASEVYYE